ncbi:MAG: UDP-N-acetylglucosamine 4,6-dehydratase (inverting) [Alphaproteobacteria bacterium]
MTGFESLDDRGVLVTGGTGSFGRAFVAAVLARHRPRRLVVYSRDEQKQAEMAAGPAFRDRGDVRFFIGDVRDRERLETAMRDIDVVVHAAALKHVPIAEYNPIECVKTNVHGAENVVAAAVRAGVARVVALSTDKAVNPINLYGATKLAADKIFVAANNWSGGAGTRFAVVRYGNVFGSRGSVVPLFRRLLAEGAASLPITDARMTRFWITLERGVEVVLATIAAMRGGEIVVPRIPSMGIVELAAALAPGHPTHLVGVRPGEKLHEVLITEDDARTAWEFADRYVVEPAFATFERAALAEAGARRVAEGFRYASNDNPDRLDAERFRGLLTNLDEQP